MEISLPVSPSAERNKEPIRDVLQAVLPASGLVLEVASGTGQHIVHFAQAMPECIWQPTDVDPARMEVLRARIADAQCLNVRAPLCLDVHAEPWDLQMVATPMAVIAINMIHIAPWSATRAFFSGASRCMAAQPGSIALLYGPYTVNGAHTAESNVQFDLRLRAENPAYGVRELSQVSAIAAEYGFSVMDVVQMPANNLCVVYRVV
jgi:hypothetical protein